MVEEIADIEPPTTQPAVDIPAGNRMACPAAIVQIDLQQISESRRWHVIVHGMGYPF
jgi:hypothetical protein